MGFVQATKTEIFLEDARTAVRERKPGYDLIVSVFLSAQRQLYSGCHYLEYEWRH
jgi:hypothetical protein